jgi:hypothetical protein
MDMIEVDSEVDGPGSLSCPVMGIGMSFIGVEPSGSAVRELTTIYWEGGRCK